MRDNKNIWIFFIFILQLMLNACHQKDDLLSQQLLQPLVPHRETIDDIPVRRPVTRNNNHQQNSMSDEVPYQSERVESPHIRPNNPMPPPPLGAAPFGAPPFPEEDDLFNPFWGVGVLYSVCGNGVVDPKEECDDGNGDNQDGCNNICGFPVCGNGLKEKFEECDNNGLAFLITGTTVPPVYGCSEDCKYQRCGNKIIDSTFEKCDDGNRVAGDGCSPCCLFEQTAPTSSSAEPLPSSLPPPDVESAAPKNLIKSN